MTHKEIHQKLIEKHGRYASLMKVDEELFELKIEVLNIAEKEISQEVSSLDLTDLAQETADVLNVIDKLFVLYPEIEPMVERIRIEKMERTIKREGLEQ
jgi:hypothetical protein